MVTGAFSAFRGALDSLGDIPSQPGRITLREGALDGQELRAVVSYDRHPIWDGGPVSAVFRRVGG